MEISLGSKKKGEARKAHRLPEDSGNARRRNPCTDKGLICRASGR